MLVCTRAQYLARRSLSLYQKPYQEDLSLVCLLLELLYGDDLALVAESKDDLLEKAQIWKTGLEAKGLKANINKTKILHCMGSTKRSDDSRK